jgi:hypothetical protein
MTTNSTGHQLKVITPKQGNPVKWTKEKPWCNLSNAMLQRSTQ